MSSRDYGHDLTQLNPPQGSSRGGCHKPLPNLQKAWELLETALKENNAELLAYLQDLGVTECRMEGLGVLDVSNLQLIGGYLKFAPRKLFFAAMAIDGHP
jgi:hypothetical protein